MFCFATILEKAKMHILMIAYIPCYIKMFVVRLCLLPLLRNGNMDCMFFYSNIWFYRLQWFRADAVRFCHCILPRLCRIFLLNELALGAALALSAWVLLETINNEAAHICRNAFRVDVHGSKDSIYKYLWWMCVVIGIYRGRNKCDGMAESPFR